jgi:hypothetical protein
VDTFDFRTAGGFINTFMVAKGAQDPNTAYLDNVWVDAAGQNLTNPIPEPASFALLGLGSLLLFGRRRR